MSSERFFSVVQIQSRISHTFRVHSWWPDETSIYIRISEYFVKFIFFLKSTVHYTTVTRWWSIGGSVQPCSGADLRRIIHFLRVVPSSLIKHNISCKNILKRESGYFFVGFLSLRYRLKQNLGATDDHIYPLRATTCTVAPQTLTTCRQVLLEELGKSCRQ